jgi:hypothetical protein
VRLAPASGTEKKPPREKLPPPAPPPSAVAEISVPPLTPAVNVNINIAVTLDSMSPYGVANYVKQVRDLVEKHLGEKK